MTELEQLLLNALERLTKESVDREAQLLKHLNDLTEQLADDETRYQNLTGQLSSLGLQVNHLTKQLEELQAIFPKSSIGSGTRR